MDALDNFDERAQQAAATEILDRMLGRATVRVDSTVEHSGGVAVVDLMDDERVERLARLLDAARARRDGQAAAGINPWRLTARAE